jgi:N-formylglutamate deformylase
MLPVIDSQPGSMPLIINVPHDGREIPADIGAKMTAEALALPDTDWHIRDLYDFAHEMGATVTSARYSRYVVDLNRDPVGKSLYPGADTTEVCPTRTFQQNSIYRKGEAPTDVEIGNRLDEFWHPYHAALEQTILDVHKQFGAVLLFDAHSIGSVLPRFFEGRLPDFNLGTADGTSAASNLADVLFKILDEVPQTTAVLNGRFKGGYITRNYGNPSYNIHAVQLEIGQSSYMEDGPPYRILPDRVAEIKPVLTELLKTGLDWIQSTSTGEGT